MTAVSKKPPYKHTILAAGKPALGYAKTGEAENAPTQRRLTGYSKAQKTSWWYSMRFKGRLRM